MSITYHAYSQISFTSEALEAGHRGFIANAVVDMNGDYLDDIVRVSYYGDVSIAYQQANGTFSISDVGTVPYRTPFLGSWGICVAETTGDAFNDFFVANRDTHYLFTSNGANAFNRIQFDSVFFAQTVNFVDMNGDEYLDLFVCNDDSTNLTYVNNGSGTQALTDTLLPMSPFSGSYGSVWTDYDNDHDMDVYIAKCKHGVSDSTDPRRINVLYRNNGDGTYSEVAAAANLADGSQSWSSDFGDIDNDGDLDVIIANHAAFHRLYLNNGDGTFTNTTSSSGIDLYTDADVFQSLFADFDNDGWIDLVLATEDNQKVIYHNDQDGTFTLVANPLDSNKLYSIALGDLNNDGFTDIYSIRKNQPPASVDDEIHYNVGNTNNWLGVNVVGGTKNRNEVGARIQFYGNWGVQTREIRSGESYGIQNSFQKIVGLGQETSFDSLTVRFVDGTQCHFTTVSELQARYSIDKSCTMTKIIDPDLGVQHLDLAEKAYVSAGYIVVELSENSDIQMSQVSLTNLKGQPVAFEIHKYENGFRIQPKEDHKLLFLIVGGRKYKLLMP